MPDSPFTIEYVYANYLLTYKKNTISSNLPLISFCLYYEHPQTECHTSHVYRARYHLLIVVQTLCPVWQSASRAVSAEMQKSASCISFCLAGLNSLGERDSLGNTLAPTASRRPHQTILDYAKIGTAKSHI